MGHLAKQFAEGMTWDNYGKWHVDHIIPKSFFKFGDTKDGGFQQCWALSNLQPLWASENCSKGAKIPSALSYTSTAPKHSKSYITYRNH